MSAHPTIDAATQLRAKGVKAEDVERIELKVHSLVLELTGKKEPKDGLEGKFSVYHAAAVALVHGAAGEAQFSDEVVRSAAVVALRRRVEALADPSIHKLEARVRIQLRNGEILEKHVERALGSFERPLTDADLEAKFRSLVSGVLPDAQADRLIELSWKAGELDDAGAIARGAAQA